MREDVIKKYVRDLDGLLKEVKSGTIPSLLEVYREDLIYENAVAFIFARLFSFFNFDYITFERKGLDAQVSIQNNEIISLEFEVFSESFIEHGHLKNIGRDERVLIVCWKDNWENPPSNIDVIELKHFWEMKT